MNGDMQQIIAAVRLASGLILANGGEVEHDFIFDMVQVDVTNYQNYMNHEGV